MDSPFCCRFAVCRQSVTQFLFPLVMENFRQSFCKLGMSCMYAKPTKTPAHLSPFANPVKFLYWFACCFSFVCV